MKPFNPTTCIHDLIKNEFDVDLPIGKGSGLSVDDAIVMKVDTDYVHNEYLVLNYLALYRFVEWHFNRQALILYGDRKYDLIKITVSSQVNSDDWTEVYYFDVTDCLSLLSKLLD